MAVCQQCGMQSEYPISGGLCPACLMELARRSAPGNRESHRLQPAAAPQALNGRIGGLEFLSLVGQGGMGAVYRARQVDLDRIVAVKILPESLANDPTFVERFRREARALARLDHPNIVRVFGSGVSDGLCYIIMEYIEGVTLRDAIHQKSIDPRAAMRIVPQICAALEFAHAAGVVHRDIKPENILLGRGGTLKVADFGLAKLTGADGNETMLTLTGATMGTMRYMAPEQFDGVEADHRADIYALGVVFYEMLTGRVPMGHFPPPSDTPGVDPRIDQVVMRTLRPEPSDRYQAISDVQSDLFRISKGEIPVAKDYAKASDSQRHQGATKRYRHPQARAFSRRRGHYLVSREWKSRAKIFGLPVMHVAFGIDPATGKRMVAKGIIAIGNVAYGGIAIGGIACGIFALGGCAFGITAIGGVAMGLLLALGGAAVGGTALGGASVGVLAVGGAAIGIVAIGGGALGAITYGKVRNGMGQSLLDASESIVTVRSLEMSWMESTLRPHLSHPNAPYWLILWIMISIVGPVMLVMAVALLGLLHGRAERLQSDTNEMPADIKRIVWGQAIGMVGAMAGLCFALLVPMVALQRARLARQQQLRAVEAALFSEMKQREAEAALQQLSTSKNPDADKSKDEQAEASVP